MTRTSVKPKPDGFDPNDKLKKQKACAGKRTYISIDEAKKHAKRYRKRFGSRMNAYKCWYCEKFHIGHDRSKELREDYLRKLQE